MDAIAVNVCQGPTSLALEEFKLLWNAKHDAQSMKNTILAIRATLLDAEARATNNHQVSFWLARLKDVLYDADDLLDDLSTEALRRGIMTRNKVAKKVPRTITRLHNLQSLNLSSNAGLRELPRDISKLVSLRHLYPGSCEWMPSGLGQLTSLQTLTDFAVADQDMHERRASARISELGELNNLRGTLRIRGLEHLRSNPTEAESARLTEKQHLQELFLSWDTFHSHCELSKDEIILEGLRPHHAIKFLCIDGFSGEKLPDWIGTLLKLQHLQLWNCRNLISLPEGLRNLRFLRTFKINGTPLLHERCQDESGDKWQEIAHNASILFARNIRILTAPACR